MRQLSTIAFVLLAVLGARGETFINGRLNFSVTGDDECSVTRSPGVDGDVVIPSAVTYNDREYKVTAVAAEAFSNCTGLHGVEIPDEVKTLGRKAFFGCTALANLFVGKSVSEIGPQCFDGCASLSSIVANPQTPPAAAPYAFDSAIYGHATLCVPAGCRAGYKAVSPWNRFDDIIEAVLPGKKYAFTLTMPAGSVTSMEDAGKSVVMYILPDEGWQTSAATFNGTDVTSCIGKDGLLATPSLAEDSELNVVFVSKASAEDIRLDAIRVTVDGNKISVMGKAPEDEVTLTDVSGALLYRGFESEIMTGGSGVYILATAGRVFKLRTK